MAQDHSHHHAQAQSDNKDYTVSRVLMGVAIGAGVIGAGIMLAPHILPALGVTTEEVAEEASQMIHNRPTGMAGAINSTMALIPVIGPKLAEGGLFTAAASALTGAGGVLLGNYISSKESDNKSIKWGTVIKYAALITSALIALPAILTGLGTGIIYCARALKENGLISVASSNAVLSKVTQTLGSIGGDYSHNLFGLEGIGAVLPHFLCCGAPFAPAIVSGASQAYGWVRDHFSGGEQSICDPQQKYSDGSVTAQMQLDAPCEPGKPCHARLILKHRDGQPVHPDELAIVHTEKLHLFVADSSLKDYHHIHPQPSGEPGVLAFTFTPQTPNNYAAWADFTLLKDGRNHKLKMDMPSASGRDIPPGIRANSSAEKNGLQFDWRGEPLQQGAGTMVEVRIADAQGNPVNDLQPVMGAFAHLVGFSADGQSIIHTHPLGNEPASTDEPGGPSLRFHVEPDCSGQTQFYLQVKRNGEDIYVPFGQHIKSPELASSYITAFKPSGHGYHAMGY